MGYYENPAIALLREITYGTITRKGIAWKEVNVICAIELADSVLLKKLKYFEVMLNIF